MCILAITSRLNHQAETADISEDTATGGYCTMIDKCFVIVLLLKHLRAGQTVRRRSNEQFLQPVSVTLGRLHAQSPKLESAHDIQAPTWFQSVCVTYDGCLACNTCMASYTAMYVPLQTG